MLLDGELKLLLDGEKKTDAKRRARTIAFIPLTFAAGLFRTIPLCILVPGSIHLGLTPSQAALILVAKPLSSFPALLIAPTLSMMRDAYYFLLAGVLAGMAFTSFYFAPDMSCIGYMVFAVIALSATGVADFLLSNKIAVGWTILLDGDVAKSSMAWEMINNVGKALGAYLGTLLTLKFGFPVTMTVNGLMWLLMPIMFVAVFPEQVNMKSEDEAEFNLKSMYKMHFTIDTLLYGWIPMFCIGGCVEFVKAVLTEFYSIEYSKSLKFGGAVLGAGSAIYSISTIVIGPLGVRFSLQYLFLVLGLAGVGVMLLLLGPAITIPQLAENETTVSASAFCLMLISSSAIQYSSLAVTARVLSDQVSADRAMSFAMNVWNLAFNAGAVLGPLVASGLLGLTHLGYRGTFAVGAPFFFASAIIVSLIDFIRKDR